MTHHQGAIETFWFHLCGQNCLGFFGPVSQAEVKMITMSTLIIVALADAKMRFKNVHIN